MFSPKWTFFRPGLVLIGIAAVGYALAIPQVRIGGAILDVHTLLVASLAGLLGFQCVLLATLARIFAAREGMMPSHDQLEMLMVERGLVFGLIAAAVGAVLIGAVIAQWLRVDFGRLDYPQTMRLVVPGMTLVAIGFQTAMTKTRR